MNEKSINIVKRYLDAENIPYAILLNGEWGSGKTWFLRNRFEELFKKKLVYTSANGLKSLDDISQQVLYRKLYLKSELVKDPRAKLAWGITKQFGKAIIEKYTGYNTDDAKKLEVDLSDFASLSADEVLVIDDIERMNSNITIEEFLGYVSTNFTEENGFKVILVADEEQLTKKLDKVAENYLNIKEKTIWQTVKYEVDIPAIYDDLIKPYSPETQKLLGEKKSYLLGIFSKYDLANLRWVLYYFQIIQDILKHNEDFLSDPNREILLCSILITCIEYKKGNLISRQGEEVPNFIKLNHPVIRMKGGLILDGGEFKKVDEPEELTPEDFFSIKYLESDTPDYHYFGSIYDLVCFGLLDFESLKDEFKQYEETLKTKEDWHVTLDRLSRLLHLEEKEFRKEWDQLLKYLNSNKYDLYDLRTIAGLYHTYSRVGIKFPTSKSELYKLLTNRTKAVIQQKRPSEDIYSHFNKEFGEQCAEYRKLMELSQKIESKFVLNDIEKGMKETIRKIRSSEAIEPSYLVSLIYNLDKKRIKEIAELLVVKTKTIYNFETAFNKALSTLRISAVENEKAKINLEYLLKVLTSKSKSKNIVRFIVKRMNKTVEDKVYRYWNHHT